MRTALRQLLHARLDRWLFRLGGREPGTVFLKQRRVFIVPTRAGFGFAALLLLMLVGAINYQLGLGFALTFVLAACGIVDMVQTSRNLALLHLAPGRSAPVFAFDAAVFELQLVNRTRLDRFAIVLDFAAAGTLAHAADVAAGAATALLLAAPTCARGWLAAPRVRLETRFPLGLFRAWSYWQPDASVLVYPLPEMQAPPLPLAGDVRGGDGAPAAGQEDFAGIRNYQAGDPLRRLAWRQIARLDPASGAPLLSKHFDGGAQAGLCLDFGALPPGLAVEARLSRLTRWVLEAERRALPYSFRLGARQFGPALGEAHRAACLQALALYPA